MKCYFSQNPLHKQQEHPENYLLDALKETQYHLENAYNGFNHAMDPELIDCYVYEMTALTKRYDYLLRQIAICRPGTEKLQSDEETSFTPLVGQVLA